MSCNAFIIAAMSADGYIAQSPEQNSISWTSKEDKKLFVDLTKNAGVVIMGRATFDTIGKPLRDRLIIVYSRTPQQSRKGIEFTSKTPNELLNDLADRGFSDVAVCGGATIYRMFLEARCVRRIHLTIEPVLFGAGIRLLDKMFYTSLELVSVERLDPQVIHLEYAVSSN